MFCAADQHADSKKKEKKNKKTPTSKQEEIMSEDFVAAIRKGDLAAVKQHVLKQGCNVTDKDGFPMLHLCVIHNKEEIAKFLIEHGCDIQAKRPDGSSALHQAAWDNRPNFVQMLVAAGAAIDAQNDRGTTALAFAAGKGFDAVVQALCFQGAKLLKNSNGKSPLDVAREKEQHSCAKLLEEYEKRGGGASAAAAAAGPCAKCAALTQEVTALKAALEAERSKNAELEAKLKQAAEKAAAAEKKE